MSEDAGGGGSSSFWRTINEIMVNVLPKPMSSANIPPARTRLS
jgi:hypothetical protein